MVLFIDNFKFSLILFFLQIRISLFFSLISTLFIGCVYSALCRLLVGGAHWLGPWRHLGKKEIKSISWAGPFLKSRILFKRITLAGVDPRQRGVHLLPLGHRARHVWGEPPGIIRIIRIIIRIQNHKKSLKESEFKITWIKRIMRALRIAWGWPRRTGSAGLTPIVCSPRHTHRFLFFL